MRRLSALITALLLLCSCAAAEVFEGSTVSDHDTEAISTAGGTLRGLSVIAGEKVTEGQLLATTDPNRLFATQDGTVTIVDYTPGEKADGVVLSVAQVSRYTVSCTIDGGYALPENDLVHIGEEVLVSCSKNGTHKGVGRVVSISGSEYTVEMLGGELYVGEAVEIYRGTILYTNRIGKGTVLSTDDVDYSVTGTILTMNVAVGDEVSRGQLLLTWSEDADLNVTCPVDGIVTAVSHRNGESVNADATVLTVTAYTDILCAVTMEDKDASRVKVGDRAVYTLKSDLTETPRSATVVRIAQLGNSGSRTVYLQPDEPEQVIGAGVFVTLTLH